MTKKIEWLYEIIKLEHLEELMASLHKRLIKTFRYYKTKKEINKQDEKGIYLFVQDFKIKYIGSTNGDLKSRISKHRKYAGEEILFFSMIKYKEVKIRRLEKALILLYEPVNNDLSYIDGKNRR